MRRLWNKVICKHKKTKIILGINERKVVCADCGKVVYQIEI